MSVLEGTHKLFLYTETCLNLFKRQHLLQDAFQLFNSGGTEKRACYLVVF